MVKNHINQSEMIGFLIVLEYTINRKEGYYESNRYK